MIGERSLKKMKYIEDRVEDIQITYIGGGLEVGHGN